MASVQHLEKLYQIQRTFSIENSLEATVAGERIDRLIEKTEQLIRQKAFLRDERRRLRIATEQVEETKKCLAMIRRTDWLSPSIMVGNERTIRMNVGGLMFEARASILVRDEKSLLAQLCGDTPPVEADSDGIYFFDRDWWLFRFILTFLRDGSLPDDRPLLAQLYREASFWQLEQMHLAIEEQKLHLRILDDQKAKKSDGKDKPKPLDKEEEARQKALREKQWWRKLPSWWRAIEEEEKKMKEEDKKKRDAEAKAKEDWWTNQAYKGKRFLPVQVDAALAKEHPEIKPPEKVFNATWSVPDK